MLSSACTSQAEEGQSVQQTRSPEVVEAGSVVGPIVVALPSRNSNADDAEFEGVADFGPLNGCFTIEGTPVVWPPGSEWSDQEQAIILESGFRIADGDSIMGGGGYFSLDNLAWHVATDGIETLESCFPDSDEIFIFNGGPNSVSGAAS